jgi:hypothetical protein
LSKNVKNKIYKTVNLPVVLFGCETCMTLREEHRLKMSENRVLQNAQLGAHNLYSSPSIIRMIKSRRMRWAGHVAQTEVKRNAYRILVEKPEGKRPLGRSRRRWMDNIKIF